MVKVAVALVLMASANEGMARENFRWQASSAGLELIKRAHNAIQGGNRPLGCSNLA